MIKIFNILMGILQILFSVGLIGFWIYFFKVENRNPERTEIYLGYERSFPVPDLLWITPSLIISAIGNLMGDRVGIFFSIISGSALVFLGLLDISFNAQQGGYTTNKSDTIMNLTINLLCVIIGPIFIIYGWWNF